MTSTLRDENAVRVPAPDLAGRLSRFTTSSGRVTSLLRLPLIALMLLIGPVVDEPHLQTGPYLSVLAGFAGWAVFVVVWAFTRPVPRWAGPVTTVVDLVTCAVLAGLSGGPTSYLTPVFYLYPVLTVFQYRPVLTGVVGAAIAIAYVGVWLENLGRSGGPSLPGVVWLHFGLLSWLALASTALTVVLTRRSRTSLALLVEQQRVLAESMAAAQRHDAQLAEHLHDGPLQDLIAVRRNLEELVEDDRDLVGDLLRARLVAQSDELLQQTIRALRGTVSSLHPQVLAQLGLVPALRELVDQVARRTGLSVTFEARLTNLPAVSSPTEDALVYSAGRELLNNVDKHAQAQHVAVELERGPNRIRLLVDDDGIGFSPAHVSEKVAAGHIGLASHAARVAAAGGRLAVMPGAAGGTAVVVELPLTTQTTTPDPHAERRRPGRWWLRRTEAG